MYVGTDYVNAVIADIGTQTTRIGFAGEDYPRVSLSTVVIIIIVAFITLRIIYLGCNVGYSC